ncbi:MAG: hypothetical protein ABW189_00230 [Rickettsiales bacterium]
MEQSALLDAPCAVTAERLYEQLLLIRSIEARMDELRVAHGSGDFMARVSSGWDAFVAPVCAAMDREDAASCADSPYSAYVARGGDVARLMTEMLHAYAFAFDREEEGNAASKAGCDAHPFRATSAKELATGATTQKTGGVTVFFASDKETSPKDLRGAADAYRAAGKKFLTYYYVTERNDAAAQEAFSSSCRSEALRQGGPLGLYAEAKGHLKALRDGETPCVVSCVAALPQRGSRAPSLERNDATSCFYRWQARDPLASLAASLSPEALKDVIFRVQDKVRDAERIAGTASVIPYFRHGARPSLSGAQSFR